MDDSAARDVPQTASATGEPSADAADCLMQLVYDELRRLAQHMLVHERQSPTIQATALVHEAYLRLASQTQAQWRGKGHFFAIAAKMLRRVLVDHARARQAAKRGGAAERITLHDNVALSPTPSAVLDVLSLHEVLEQLESLDARQARVVELRFFGGLTNDEVAEVLHISPRTVKDDWRFARAWLQLRLASEE